MKNQMRKYFALLLVCLFCSELVHAGGLHGNSGTGNGTGAASGERSTGTPAPSIGLVGQKAPAGNGAEGFNMPKNAASSMDKWFGNNIDQLQSDAWSDPNRVSDEDVVKVKEALGKALKVEDPSEFAKNTKIGISPSGTVRVEFKDTGQIYTYSPGERSKYK